MPNSESRYPLYTPTKAEAAAIRKGRAAYKRGDYITLNYRIFYDLFLDYKLVVVNAIERRTFGVPYTLQLSAAPQTPSYSEPDHRFCIEHDDSIPNTHFRNGPAVRP